MKIRKFIPAILATLAIVPHRGFTQTVQIIAPPNLPANTPVQFDAPERQVFPVYYPAESISTNLHAGTNYYRLNPGWWTAGIGRMGIHIFYVSTNDVTNNILSIVSNPPLQSRSRPSLFLAITDKQQT